MTRGTFLLLKDGEVYASCEFNGDMYYTGHGEAAVNRLAKVNTVSEFERMVQRFNEDKFGYEEEYVRVKKLSASDERELNLKYNYIQNWFSDYLYIKNADTEPWVIQGKAKTGDGKEDETADIRILKPGCIMWFYFGKYSGEWEQAKEQTPRTQSMNSEQVSEIRQELDFICALSKKTVELEKEITRRLLALSTTLQEYAPGQ